MYIYEKFVKIFNPSSIQHANPELGLLLYTSQTRLALIVAACLPTHPPLKKEVTPAFGIRAIHKSHGTPIAPQILPKKKKVYAPFRFPSKKNCPV